jgi:hypothetical protein
MTYYRVCSKSSTCGAGNAYPLGALEFTPCFQRGSCCSIFSLMCCVFYIIVCLFLFFIVLPVLLRFTTSDYLFGIFKPFLCSTNIYDHNDTNGISIIETCYYLYFRMYKYYSLIVCKNLYERVRTCIVQSFVILYLIIPNVRYDFRIKTMFGSSLPTGVCRSPRAYVLFTLLVFVRV